MKFLIILGLLLALLAVIAVRYRRQIQMAIYMWRMFRKMRQVSKAGEKQIENKEPAPNAPLVRCAGCGMWISENKILKLGAKSFYCSADCMEKAVKVS